MFLQSDIAVFSESGSGWAQRSAGNGWSLPGGVSTEEMQKDYPEQSCHGAVPRPSGGGRILVLPCGVKADISQVLLATIA